MIIIIIIIIIVQQDNFVNRDFFLPNLLAMVLHILRGST